MFENIMRIKYSTKVTYFNVNKVEKYWAKDIYNALIHQEIIEKIESIKNNVLDGEQRQWDNDGNIFVSTFFENGDYIDRNLIVM